MSDAVETMASESARFLLSGGNAGFIIKLVLYVLGMALIFVLPIYLRDWCNDRQLLRARDRDMEDAPPTEDAPGAATGRASVEARTEARTRRKKYRAERRARIVQVFSQVSMILREEDFHRGPDEKQRADETQRVCTKVNTIVAMEEGIMLPPKAAKVTNDDDDDGSSNNDDVESEGGVSPQEIIDLDDPYAEETNFVEIPSTVNGDPLSTSRLVPCLCIICLGQYEVGEELVWSSNPLCEHTFHERCIEKWLMKQRGGLLCPCCRRDFIIDPFDLDDVEGPVDFPSHEHDEENTSTNVPVIPLS